MKRLEYFKKELLNLLSDDDLTDEKLRHASEGLLPNLSDELNKINSQQYIDKINSLEVQCQLMSNLQSLRIQDLQQSNKDLVEMLEFIFYKTNFQSHFPTTSIKVKNLLSKHTTHDNRM